MSALPWVAFLSVAVVLLIFLAGCFALEFPRKRRRESDAGSVADPRVARMDLKQRAYGKRLRREGRTLLAGKEYIPTLTIPAPAKPPRADKVVLLRRAK